MSKPRVPRDLSAYGTIESAIATLHHIQQLLSTEGNDATRVKVSVKVCWHRPVDTGRTIDVTAATFCNPEQNHYQREHTS